MGTTLFIIGALLKVYPPDPTASEIQPASKAMAGLLYIYAVGYSIGWGPVPWIYVSDIFPTRTRHYGLSVGSGTEWLFSTRILSPRFQDFPWKIYLFADFVITKITPTMQSHLGWKMFMVFATINYLGMATFALYVTRSFL